MESLSRPLHRRKLSNVNTFSGKNPYDGVLSVHRKNYDATPPVSVDDYREIFSTAEAGSSIPVLDLSSLDESSDEVNMEGGSLRTDYGNIFGGFRDMEIAISYEELVARDKARAPSSTSPSCQDSGDLSPHSSDAWKQFNLSYNKISQRSKDGLDVTTHVTQLHAVPGFTCFIDESASQPNKETVKQKSSSKSSVDVHSRKGDIPQKQTATDNVNGNSSEHEKQTATKNVNGNSSKPEKRTAADNLNGNSSNPGKQTATNNINGTSSKPEKRTATNYVNGNSSKPEKQTATNNVNGNSSMPEKQTAAYNANANGNSSKRDFPEKSISQTSVEFESRNHEESLSHDRDFKTFEVNFRSHSSKVLSSPESEKETNKQKLHSTNNIPSSPPAASEPKQESEKQKSSVTNNVCPSEKVDIPEKQTSQTAVQPQSQSGQGASFSDDRNFKQFQTDIKSHPSKESSLPAASQPKKEPEKQKSFVTNNVHPCEKVDIGIKQTSQTAVESRSTFGQDKSFSDDRDFKPIQTDLKSYPSKASSSPAASATNLDTHKDYQKRSRAGNEEFPRTYFDEELDVNSAAAASTAALRKAIEKAQESIRIAKESVGRKKKGFRGSSSKSFNDSLKVKARVANVNTGVEQKEKDDEMKEQDHKTGSTIVFPDFAVREKLFGAKKVVNEIHGTTSASAKNSEIPIRSPFELKNDELICNSKQIVDGTETKSIENNACEGQQKDNERPNGFLVLENCETKLEGTESNKLTVCQKVETEKEVPQKSDQSGYAKKPSDKSFGLLVHNMQEHLEQEHEEKVASAEMQDKDERRVKEDGGTGSHSEEEKFYDVCEVEMIKTAQTCAYSVETNDLSQTEDYEDCKAKETCENSASEYDDAEENENVIGVSNIVDSTEEACEFDQNVNNAESSQDIDDVSSSHEFQVECKEAVKREINENISSDEKKEKDECEAKSDNVENHGLTDVGFGQNYVQFESSADTIRGMEIEVKVYKEKEETVGNEENNLQQSHEEIPEHRVEIDTQTPQEPKDACREPEPSKEVHEREERERERIKLAVERAIREARERAFAEVRQRVIADSQEKVTKASTDKISAQSKLRVERALVERATAEARQRALEKAMKISEPRTQVTEMKQTSSPSQTNVESALRSKAKLEKHNRIMERAAKALAEKEKRDLLALREQAERNRLAEILDADIKRWSTGKEGNLRALLSTLQYVLGADSGWQPVSLTEIITTSAVKKAYRKATLCVHPDKLQQRGASIQQKYVCEKVFDLLKAAWNRFNSEER